jgi:hypothetical protein
MTRRQSKGDYYGGSTVVSSDFGFSPLAPSLGTPRTQNKPTELQILSQIKSEKRKAKLRAKKKRHKPSSRQRRTPLRAYR